MMAQHEIQEGAKLFYRKPEANTWGILNVREEFAKDNPEIVKRVIKAYEEARKYSLANSDELKKIFIGVTKLPEKWSTSSSRSAPKSPITRSARRSATRSWKPASRCRSPASIQPTWT